MKGKELLDIFLKVPIIKLKLYKTNNMQKSSAHDNKNYKTMRTQYANFFINKTLWLLGGAFLVLSAVVILGSKQPVYAACSELPTDKGQATASITVPSDGTYRVWSRIMAPDSSNNSYLLDIGDDNCGITVGGAAIASNAWTWVDYKDGNTGTKIDLTLTAGTYTVKMAGEGANVKLDRILLLSDTSCTPTDTGNNCTPGVHIGTTAWQSFSIESQTDTFDFEFDAIPNMNNMDGVTGLSTNTAAGYSDLAAIARFNSNGFIDARSGSSYQADVSLAYTAGTSYHFKLTVDIPSHTYSVTVTPAGQSAVTLATNYPFRTEQASANVLNYWSLYSLSGSHSVSNVQVNADTEPDPDPDPEPEPIPGDLNNDNEVNIFDLSILLSNWNTSDASADLNGDNIVNIFDLSILLSNWGT